MPRGKPEQAEHIIPKLREVGVEVGRGKRVAEAVKKIGVRGRVEAVNAPASPGLLWLLTARSH